MNRHRYEDDVVLWAEEQAALLRAGETSALDLENLAEEIESLGRSEKRELDNRLTVLIQHLLKYQYQPEHRSASWRGTIREQRRCLELVLRDNPSLRRLLPAILPEAAAEAREKAADETGLFNLPRTCPFTLEQILDRSWLPD